jgi:hypothetical protein
MFAKKQEFTVLHCSAERSLLHSAVRELAAAIWE